VRVPPVPALAGAVLMVLLIVLLRLATDERDGVFFLLALPIGLVAAELGWPTGITAAAIALAIVAICNDLHGVSFGPVEYLTRAVVYLGTGISIGLLNDRSGRGAGARPPAIPPSTPPDPGTPGHDKLSPREVEVLQLIASGATNAQIAERFVISKDTVKSHVKRILQKLGVSNRTEAALRYVELYGHPRLTDS
jgi:DNA-binding CsgD family transcriptional regulator